jgi:hypothetical protein
MASTLSIIWERIIRDLTLYEHEFTIEEVSRRQFTRDEETPEEREERLHTEIAGAEGDIQ